MGVSTDQILSILGQPLLRGFLNANFGPAPFWAGLFTLRHLEERPIKQSSLNVSAQLATHTHFSID